MTVFLSTIYEYACEYTVSRAPIAPCSMAPTLACYIHLYISLAIAHTRSSSIMQTHAWKARAGHGHSRARSASHTEPERATNPYTQPSLTPYRRPYVSDVNCHITPLVAERIAPSSGLTSNMASCLPITLYDTVSAWLWSACALPFVTTASHASQLGLPTDVLAFGPGLR